MTEDLHLSTIILPKPAFSKGTDLFAALKKRMTSRNISNKKLTIQEISNLLWAAYGVNRKIGPFGVKGRTAGSASNSQEIDIYIALQEGIYQYDAFSHRLNPVIEGDYRKYAIGPGQQSAGAHAPVRLIYVVDIEKFKCAGFQEPGLYDKEIQKAYYYIDTGLIAENVYLFASSQGLATWFHNCDKAALAKILHIRKTQRILFGQTVGKPGKK